MHHRKGARDLRAVDHHVRPSRRKPSLQSINRIFNAIC
jgi:hypothetical protein